jgi:DNA-binding YbaB/EbfC family protein
MDVQYLMRQAKKIEKAMEEAKAKLADLEVEAESGGGLVQVRMNGRFEVRRIAIEAKAAEGDRAMLEDLVAAAVNAAVEKARAAAAASMAEATGGINVPGLGF